MLKGIDISHHQKNMKDVRSVNKFDFVIMKATEGRSYRDPALMYFNKCLDPEHLKGFYHFARADRGNSPEAEASNFINTILPYLDDFSIIALDLEDKTLFVPDIDTWALKWCKAVFAATGKTPLIYCSESDINRFKKCSKWGCGLWVAKWSILKPTKKAIQPWKVWAIWQYSSKAIHSGVRVDTDYFNGDREQFLKYARN